MKHLFSFFIILVALVAQSCATTEPFDPASVADAEGKVSRVEPLSWWVGMNTPLQLLIQGENISEYDLRIEGGGVKVEKIHKADSPNYIFVDVAIDKAAEAGSRYLVFTKGDESFKVEYEIAARREGSRDRESFTTADVIYLIMPDRFANGDAANDSTDSTVDKAARGEFYGRHGGDIQGVIDHLDYIADMGMTALWSTPMLLDNEPFASYHGYACADYYHIDPRMGDNSLYRTMVEEAHKRGIKVIMDMVTNHCGISHWWMQDLPFEDWVHKFEEGYVQTNNIFGTNMDINASQSDLKVQESGWFDVSMPDMNLDNPYLLQYFKQWAVWWVEYADLDGMRVDTYPYNEKGPMSEWCKAVMAEYPSFNIVGECWTGNVPQLAYWQGGNKNADGFDSHLPSIMDFPLRDAICSALPNDNPGWGEGMMKVYDAVSNDFVYHDLSKMMIFTGNHDTDRTADIVRGDVARMKIAMALLSTMRGIPQIFAGDEMALRSADLSQGHGGLRVDFPGGWEGDKLNLFDEKQRTGDAAIVSDYTRRLLQWRKSKEVIHTGRTMHFAGRDNTYAFFRYNDTDVVFVYVNNSKESKPLRWSRYGEIASNLSAGRCVISGEEVTLSDDVVVAPHEVIVVEYKR
ncbi:MAG: glycoside hydrolase family 13 protein [Alistipes sp.]|nr:glycoside hydrolase family 13 protein [Alistipes sp.]